MSAASEQDILNWRRGVDSMHSYVGGDTFDLQSARDQVQMLWSGNGFRETQDDVQQLFVQLVEIGYMAALRDVREGRYDDQVRSWREFG